MSKQETETVESNKIEDKTKSPKSSPKNSQIDDYFEEYFDAISELAPTEQKRLTFIKSSFNASIKADFYQKIEDWNLWRIIVITFFCAHLIRKGWLITAFIIFITLLSMYIQWNRAEKSKAVEYCARIIAKDPDRLRQFLAAVNAPQNLSLGKSGDAPSEWINDILAKFWPFINSIAQNEIDKKGFSKEGLDVGNGHTIYFMRFTLGDKPPAITSINVKKTGKREDEITIILKVIYFGNCLLSFSYKTKVFLKAKAGVKDVYFRGDAIIVLRPLLQTPPFIGGLSFCLNAPPLIDYEGMNLANIADNKIFKNFFVGIISSFLVSPNKIYVPLLNNPNIKRELKFPLPIGLCYVQIIEAENLPPIDPNKCCIFEGSSDVFCKVKVGDYQFMTSIIYGNLNPYFGQSFSAPVHDFNDLLKIELFDKDAISSDDFMGSVEFKTSEISEDKNFNGRDKWLPIGKSPSGSLHFRIAVFELSRDKKQVNKISLAIKESSCKFTPAILSVYIYYVSHISTIDEEINLKPVVVLKFSKQSFETRASQQHPEKGYYYIEESSHFMCNDLENDVLEVSVVCLDKDKILAGSTKNFGSFNIPTKEIIDAKNMTLNKEFPIKRFFKAKDTVEEKESGFVKMFISLKICKYRKRLIDNLKIASSIQTNIEQTIADDSSLANLVKEPVSSLRNPIRSIGFKTFPFTAPKKTIVAEDLLPVPLSLGDKCNVKARIKWPDRRSLHIEVLKVIHMPLSIVDPSFKYSICVKLSLKYGMNKSLIERQKFKQNLSRVFQKRKDSKSKPQNVDNYSALMNRKHLASRHTKKHFLDNLSTNVVFNERLEFRLSPLNNIDNHVLDFLLIVHKPRKFFAVTFNSSLVASSVSSDLPAVDFKGDPIEKWYQLDMHQKFLRVKTK